MAFEDKKGIVVASPFKLQAEALLDVRQQVDTIAERDRLVTLKAATAGLRVFVKENSTSYVYTGTKWDPLATGAPYKHPTGDGNHHVPATGTTNAGKYLKAGATAGSEAWAAITAADITGLPTRLPNPQSLTIKNKNGSSNKQVVYTGSDAQIVELSSEWVYGASDAPLATVSEYSEAGTRYVKILEVDSDERQPYRRVHQQFIINGINFSFILDIHANQLNAKVFSDVKASIVNISTNDVDISNFIAGIKNVDSTHNKVELWYKQKQWQSALAIIPKGRSFETTEYLFNIRSYNNSDPGSSTAPVFDIPIRIVNKLSSSVKLYGASGQATDGAMTQKATTDALNSKAPISHTHNTSQITGLPTKLPNPYALTIKTNGTAAATYDGSVVKEVNITPAVIGAAASSHNHSDKEIRFGGSTAGRVTSIDQAISNVHSSNRFAFANPAGIKVEYSRNGGESWSPYNDTDEYKIALVSGIGHSYYIGGVTSGITIKDKLRITLNPQTMKLYTSLDKLLINVSTSGALGCTCLVEKSLIESITNYETVGTYPIEGWSGWNSIWFEGIAFGGGENQTSNTGSIRLTFSIGSLSENKEYSNALQVSDIYAIGSTYWAYPSEMAKSGHIYKYTYDKRAIFPNTVESEKGFIGNASSASQIIDPSDKHGINISYVDEVTKATYIPVYKDRNNMVTATVESVRGMIGAAPISHTHTASQVTDLPTKLPNPQPLKFTGAATATYDGSGAVTVNIPTAQASPHALTVQLNGGSTEDTNKFTFNGGAAKNINITPASIGAAASTHSHNYAGSGSAGGAANSAVKLTTARTINGVLFDGTSNIEIPNNYSKALNTEDLNTVLAIGEYYAGGGNTVKNKPSGVQHFGMKVYKVASGYIAQKLHGSDNIIYYRVHDNASFGAWQKVYSTAAKPTAAEIGAAPSSHNHTASQITGLPTKLPNPQPLKFTGAATATYDGSGAVTVNIPTAQASPHALTVQLNGGTSEGTNKFTFNGGAAKNINITPASIGAALASHTHPGYAPTSHTHTAGQITGLPTSLKNPYALTIKTNGSAVATYDGSAVKEVNITAAGIGAAATSHGHNLGNGTTPGFTKLYKWEDSPSTEDFTGAITSQFLAQYTTNKIVPRISENANNISKIVNGTTPVGKSKQLVDSVNNQGIGLTYDEISKTGPFDRCKFAMFYNNSIIGGMTPNRVTDFIGAAKASHTHTPASIGAAPSSHTHNYAGSSSAGGPANSAKKVDFPVGTVLWTTSSSATFFSSTCGGTWEVVGNIDTIINSSTTLTLYMHKKKAL